MDGPTRPVFYDHSERCILDSGSLERKEETLEWEPSLILHVSCSGNGVCPALSHIISERTRSIIFPELFRFHSARCDFRVVQKPYDMLCKSTIRSKFKLENQSA